MILFALPAQAAGKKSLSKMSDEALLKTLGKSRIETLYYNSETFPKNIRELCRRPELVPILRDAFTQFPSDDLHRFNIIVILNQRRDSHPQEREAIYPILLYALGDESPWVRTEAVWGLGFSADSGYIAAVMPLLDDPDTNVVNEAIMALTHLTGQALDVSANQNMSDHDRAIYVAQWKSWWNGTLAVGMTVLGDSWVYEIESGPRFVTKKLRPLARTVAAIAGVAEQFMMQNGRPAASIFELMGFEVTMARPSVLKKIEGDVRYIASLGHRSYSILAFDQNGKLVLSAYLGGLTDHVALEKSLAEDKPIARTPINLLWTPPWETNPLGHLVADAMREITGADVALFNAYGLRDNIPMGAIHAEHIRRALPFGNQIVVVKLKGADLIEVMRKGVDDRWFLYPSGLTAVHNHRLGIPAIAVETAEGTAIDPARKYSVAVPDYLATGGDGYPWLTAVGPGENRGDLREAVAKYLRKHRKDWKPDSEPRILVQ